MSNAIKILVVEDDRFLLSMYADKFKTEHFDVVVAADGAQVLPLAKAEQPAVILLDVLLPKMNGFEVLAELKKEPETKDIPVILLTNLSQRDDVNRGMELGAADFLIKAHFMPNEVVNKVRALLAKNQTHA
jgi:DNA-binding response OmpR family regulator